MSSPARSDGPAASAPGSALTLSRSSGSGTGAVESKTASGPAAPPLPFSASSASALPAQMPAVSVAPAVTVEDESTKRCSACLEDHPTSAFSSAQLKKKGKRVCQGCVAKKAGAAAAQQEAAAESAAKARKDAMKDAFAARLNAATPLATAVQCLCCGSKAAVRSVACIRCTVECCSLRCFDGHDCDAYLEAKRTMPTELIPDEDRFHSEAELLDGWKDLVAYLRTLPASVSDDAAQLCARPLQNLSRLDDLMLEFVKIFRMHHLGLYSPCVSHPWWNLAACARVRCSADIRALVTSLIKQITVSAQCCTAIVCQCASTSVDPWLDREAAVHGACVTMPTIECASACFLPSRLFHKLLMLLRWILRAMGSEWTQAQFDHPGDVSSAAFGAFPSDDGNQNQLGYLELPDPDTGLRTLVSLFGDLNTASRLPTLRQHLGHRMLLVVLRDGQVVLDRGIYLSAAKSAVEVCAVSGWTGNVTDSFLMSQARSSYWSDQWLSRAINNPVIGDHVREEIEARKRPDYFHLVLAIKQMIPEDEWPGMDGATLFIATPQRGIESELVELSLLESIVEDAAAGNEQAQLVLAHIESECAAPIAEVIARQKSRLDQMLEDQAAQLQIHAEAVKRAELRGRIKGPSTVAVDGAVGPAASASVSSSSVDAALAPTSATSSSSSAVSAARAPSSLDGPAYSWTQSREYKGLESLREPGRKKYSTIMSAAKKLLYSLRPVSVNKRGGSHIWLQTAQLTQTSVAAT